MQEAAAAADALGRAAAFEVCGAVLGSLPAVAALGARQALPPVLQGLLPLPGPVAFLSRWRCHERQGLVTTMGTSED